MKLPLFKLEDYFSDREFRAPFHLCASDTESWTMQEILQMADGETIALWDQLGLHYTEPRGHPLLREEIGKGYAPHIDAGNLLCFPGAEEGIYAAVQALLEPGDHTLVITPCYQSLETLPAQLGPTTAIPLEYEKGWQLDIKAVAKAIQPKTKLLLINYPHNPTGALISLEEQRALVELARKHGIWIFSDEVYRHLELEPENRLPPLANEYEKGLSLGVMSKAYGLPGLRIGWIACQDKGMLEKIGAIKHYLSICNGAPSEILSLIALRSSDQILSRNVALMKTNLARLNHFFKKYEEWFEWVEPKGGCIAFPKFKGPIGTEQLANILLEEAGILILPSQIYDHADSHFRISFGRKDMPAALDRFSAFIEEKEKTWGELK